MKSLLLWSLLAGLVLCLHRGESKSLKTNQAGFDLQNEEDVGDRYEKSTITVNTDPVERRSTLRRRASPRKGINRSLSAPSFQYASPWRPLRETKGDVLISLPKIKTHTESPARVSRVPSAPNLKHDTGLHPSRAKNQKSTQESLPKIRTHADVPVGASPVSSYRTPFSSVQGSPSSSSRYSMIGHLTRTTSFQKDQSGSSAITGSSTNAASSQPVGSSDQMFTRLEIKPDPGTPGKPLEKGFASRIGKPLLWVQNNPAKALRIGASMTANAASGGAAVAAAHHNVPGAACLAIASAAMKVGIDCYDGQDKVQAWHKQKGIDPKENAEATKRMVEAAKKPVSGLWRTISRPLSSQQSMDKPWPIDSLPVRKRSIGYRRLE